MHVEGVLALVLVRSHGAPDNEGSGHLQSLLNPPLPMHISSHFPVDPLEFMALRTNLGVPGVRLPSRKERKSKLRLLDRNDGDYKKGGYRHA